MMNMDLEQRNAVEQFNTCTLDEKLSCSEIEKAEESLIGLAQQVLLRVPAYRTFLQAQGVDVFSIASLADIQRLPLVSKDNYMRQYPLPDRCWEGDISHQEMIAVSSGSTGSPMFWPRSQADELDVSYRFEQVFRDSFRAHERSTLAVVCFAMGTWVGGMYSAQSCRYLSAKGYSISSVTPGNNKLEIFRVIQELGPYYDQVVLLGYPPFLKDVINDGIAQGIDWRAYQLKFVFAGEVFSEEWRALLCERAGGVSPDIDTASLYGTADAGVLGNETRLSIRIRQFLSKNPLLASQLFGETRLPTLVQYDPNSRYFEVVDNTLVVSGNSGTPLIRYHIADRGGVISFNFIADFVRKHIPNLIEEIGKARPLPFAFLFGRADFTVSYFGANIYPENICVGLEQATINEWVTGKFVLEVQEGAEQSQLRITVELLPSIEASQQRLSQITESIVNELRRLNSEFSNYVPQKYQHPEVTLLPFGEPNYFPVGVKHRYTRQSV